MKTVITVCDTCKTESFDPDQGLAPDGQRLFELVQQASESDPNLVVRSQSCLMGCDRACNIAIQGTEKLHYVLGRFEADDNSAKGIVEYAKLYGESDTGQVPYKQWPQEVKGHFVARLPTLPKDSS